MDILHYEVHTTDGKDILVSLCTDKTIYFMSCTNEARKYKYVTRHMRKCKKWGIFYSTILSPSDEVTQLEFDRYTKTEESTGRKVDCCNSVVYDMIQYFVFGWEGRGKSNWTCCSEDAALFMAKLEADALDLSQLVKHIHNNKLRMRPLRTEMRSKSKVVRTILF